MPKITLVDTLLKAKNLVHFRDLASRFLQSRKYRNAMHELLPPNLRERHRQILPILEKCLFSETLYQETPISRIKIVIHRERNTILDSTLHEPSRVTFYNCPTTSPIQMRMEYFKNGLLHNVESHTFAVVEVGWDYQWKTCLSYINGVQCARSVNTSNTNKNQ
jgi:hypothetical protein